MTGDDPLIQARALVLHDLSARGFADAQTVSTLELALSNRRWWLSQWAEGVDYVAGLVAQDVQDTLLETVGRWPLCTACEDEQAHSLYIEPELGADPHWICQDSGKVVAPLGDLG